MTSLYQKAYFLLSAAKTDQLPEDQGMEVAIVGRSNAGKSSVLNRITRNKSLARVSKTPGRTQLINVFVLDERRRLTDLPGYGYAKVPVSMQKQWAKTVNVYLETRQSLKGLILVMDIRHPMREMDLQLLSFCEHYNLPVHIILNKSDKLSKNAVLQTTKDIAQTLTAYHNSVTFQVFSALKGNGIDELYSMLNQWYNIKS